MKYAEASQEIRERELKEAEIGDVRVATMVESRAARKEPSQLVVYQQCGIKASVYSHAAHDADELAGAVLLAKRDVIVVSVVLDGIVSAAVFASDSAIVPGTVGGLQKGTAFAGHHVRGVFRRHLEACNIASATKQQYSTATPSLCTDLYRSHINRSSRYLIDGCSSRHPVPNISSSNLKSLNHDR